MKRTDAFKQFILTNNFNDENIDYLLKESTLKNRNQLIAKTFKEINSRTGNYLNDEYNMLMIINACNLISTLCEKEEFTTEQIAVNRTRIKKARESILVLSNKYRNNRLLQAANILDEIILDKNVNVKPIITLVKDLIDKKEDVNIIKKILGTSRGAIILNDNELFDYTFNKSLTSLTNDTTDIYYYIALLKIFYTTKIDRDKYVRMLNIVSDESNIFANEIYSILYGNKRSLSEEEIEDKYGIIKDFSNVRIIASGVSDIGETVFTIDRDRTEIRDDALSIKKLRNKYLVGIHITDVGGSITPYSEADFAAKSNFKCLYLYGSRRNRLFSEKVERSLSLNKNKNRKSITLYVLMDDSGDVLDYYLKNDTILVSHNLSYTNADKVMNYETSLGIEKDLNILYNLALALKQKNKRKEEYWKNKGREDETTKSGIIVNEFMVLYNHILPKIAIDNNFYYIYRAQGKSYIRDLVNSLDIELDEETEKLLDTIYLRSIYSSEPLPHEGLGFNYYSHSADPLRRYTDTDNQYLLHKFYFKDLDYNFDYEEFLKHIEYFNQRDAELSLMRSEYSRALRKN